MKKILWAALWLSAPLYAQSCPHPGREAGHFPLGQGLCLTTLFGARGSAGARWERYTAGYVHLGADFSMALSEIVFAPAAGTVQGVYNNPRYGDENHIWIKFDSSPAYFVYGHLYAYVTNGQRLKKGDCLGEIAKNKTMAPHLHLGVHSRGEISGWGRAQTNENYRDKGFADPLKPEYAPYLPKPDGPLG